MTITSTTSPIPPAVPEATAPLVDTQASFTTPAPAARSGPVDAAAPGGPTIPAGHVDPADAALAAVSASLLRRGYLTTEFFVTVIGAVLAAVLALVHVPGPTAAQVVAVAAPALLAAVYAVVRTMHKSRLSQLVADVFPQSSQTP